MKGKKPSKELELKIIEVHKTKSEKEVAQLFNLSISGIRAVLKRNNVKGLKKSRMNMSHLKLNIEYFKKIDSKDKAYWLGFICADGNINKTNNKVSLVSKDLCVIEKFKVAIESDHKISEILTFDKRTNKTYTGYTIQIGNEIFTQNLINLGVTNNKTDVLTFPNIDEKFYSYFVAGLFDGDGSISWYGKNKNLLRCNLISTKEVLVFIQNYLNSNFDIKIKQRGRVSKNKPNVWKLAWYKDANKFLNFIYGDEKFPYLERKYNLYKRNERPFLFLDIDGVLSLDFDEHTYSNQKKWFEKMTARCPFNKKAVKKFNDICTAVNPIIILSSDWKDHYDIDLMNEFFEWNGITYKITEYTSNLWGVKFKSLQELEECRAAEINLYVHEREIKNWVAIDDLDLSPWIPNNFVHTPKSNEGIKQTGVKEKVLNILLN